MSNEIPTVRRIQVREREQGRCARCQMKGAHWHHRRTRSVRDEHTHCACNGVWLCSTCHTWAHAWPVRSRPAGFVIPRHVTEMWMVPYRRLGRLWVLPTCEGLLASLADDQVEFEGTTHPTLVRPSEGRTATGV